MFESLRDFGEPETREIGSEDVVAACGGDVGDEVTELVGGCWEAVQEEDGWFGCVACFAIEDFRTGGEGNGVAFD